MTGKRPVFSVKGLSQFTRDQIYTPINFMIPLQIYYPSLFPTFSTGNVLSQQEQTIVTKFRNCLWSSTLSFDIVKVSALGKQGMREKCSWKWHETGPWVTQLILTENLLFAFSRGNTEKP